MSQIERAGGAARVGSRERHGVPVLVVVFLLTLLIPAEFNLGGLKMNLSRLFLLAATPILVAQLFAGRFGRPNISDVFFIGYVIWMGVALFVNNPSRVVQNVGSTGLEFIGGYMIGRAAMRDAGDFSALIKFLAFIVMATLPFAVVESQTSVPVLLKFFHSLPGINSYPDVQHEPRLGLWRAQVMLVHPIHYGLFCSTVFTLVFVGLKDDLSTFRRYLLAFGIGSCTFLSLSSGAFLALVLQLGLIFWAWVLRDFKRPWLLLIALMTIAYVMIDLASNRTPIEVFLSYATFSSHTAYWRKLIFEWGMINVWANPLWGIGLNDWVRPYYMYSGSMDNFWLVTAVRYGIPGAFFMITAYAVMLLRISFRDLSGDRRLLNLRRAWVITFCGLAFTLSTVHVWTTVYSYIFFLFGAGSWLLSVSPASQDEEAEAQAPSEPSSRRLRYTRFPLAEEESEAGAKGLRYRR